MKKSSQPVYQLCIPDITSDESSSDKSPIIRKKETVMTQQPQSGLSSGKDPKSDQRTTGPSSRKRDAVQTNGKQDSPQLTNVTGSASLTGNIDYLPSGKKERENRLKNEELRRPRLANGAPAEVRTGKMKDLGDKDLPSVIIPSANISHKMSNEIKESDVEIRRSGSSSVQSPRTVDSSVVSGNDDLRRTPSKKGGDRRGVIIQDSTIGSYAGGCGTLDPNLLDRRIQQTKRIFVETENYANADTKLIKKGYVTLCGGPGEGKTSLALMLGVKYQQHGYNLVFVDDVDKFRLTNQFELRRKLFVVFDDIFGTVGLTTDVPHLRSTLQDLRNCLESRAPQQEETTVPSLLVVFTTSLCNFQSESSKLGWEKQFFFTPQKVITLNEAKAYQLSLNERKTMFEKYKLLHDSSGVQFKEIADCMPMGIGFPLTCQLFWQYKPFQNSSREFFQKPLFILTKEFQNILEQKNEKAAALVLLLLCDGKLDLIQLGKRFKNTRFESLYRSIQTLMPCITETETIKAVQKFQGTFFTYGNHLGFSHHILYDVFSCVLHRMDPKFVIKHCSLKFLYERFRHRLMESVTDYQHFIYITDSHHDIIVKRLIQAVKEGNYMIFTHPVLKNKQIVEKLFDQLNIQKILSKENKKVLLHWTIHSHNLCLVQKIFASGYNFSDADILGAFEECAFSGDLEVMDFLKAKYASIKQDSIIQALATATENNYNDMVQYLLKNCQDVIPLQNECNVLVTASNNNNVRIEKDIVSVICSQRKISTSCTETIHLLHAACVKGDVTLAKFVIPATDINKTFDGLTPVMSAAISGQREVFDLLVSKGANLRLTDRFGNSLLNLASLGGNVDIVKHLLPLFDINIRGQDDITPVMKASLSGQNDVFDLFVSKKADLRLTDKYGNNVLHGASCGNSTYILDKLLPLFDINARGHVGWTALMRAAYNGQEDAFDLLVSRGADLTLKDNLGANVFHWACCSNSIHIVEQLLPMFDVNIRGYRGLTPVMHAASHGQNDVFNLLVSKGADLTLKDNHDNSVLHFACCSNNTAIVKQLLMMFDVNIRGQNGLTPLMNAACHGQKDVFNLLLAEGADQRLTNDFGSNLLYCASLGGNRYIIEQLLTLFDINSRGRKSMTAVMAAANEGHEEVFALLVKKGADLTLTDADDNNLLHLAHRGGCESIVDFLSTTHL